MTPSGATDSFLQGGTHPSALLWLEDAAPGTPLVLDRAAYAQLFGPTVGGKNRGVSGR